MKRIALLVILLASTGLGCTKATPQKESTPKNPTAKPAQQQTTEPVILDRIIPEAQYAKQALQNLATANSYHSEMIIPGVGKDVTASMTFVKTQGLRGTLSIPTEEGISISEVYLSKEEVWHKTQGGAWENISGSEEAKELTDSLQGSFVEDEDGDFILNGSEQFLAKQEKSSCTEYTFRQVTTEGMLQTFRVCITKQDLPQYIEIETKSERPIRINYSALNEITSIEKPQ